MGIDMKPYDERWSSDQVDECAQLWNLTDDEKGKLLELKERISDLDHCWKNDPFEAIRFLHEFKFNLKVTEQKFRHSMDWRHQHKVDRVLETYAPPQLYNYFPMGVLEGSDHEGDPIYVERSGAADTLGLLHRFGKEEMLQQAMWGRELMSRGPWQKHRVKRVKNFTVILDLKGLNRSHLSPSLVPVGQQVTRFVQDNYPGFAKKILVIRAPYLFRFVWNIFKHFVDPHVKELLEIATEKETEGVLEQYLDLEVLPNALAPGKGKGKAVPGYDPVWEGGPLPPPSKDDETRVPLVYPGEMTEDDDLHDKSPTRSSRKSKRRSSFQTPERRKSHTKHPQQQLPPPQSSEPPSISPSNDIPRDVRLKAPMTPLEQIVTPGTSYSSINSSAASEWEALPKGSTKRRPIRQAWTVTPNLTEFNVETAWCQENMQDVAELWELTNVEQGYMEQLKERLADIQHYKNDPFEVVRYLFPGGYRRHHKINLDKVEHAFRDMVAWRVENDMDTFLQRYGQPNPLFHYMPICNLRGLDKDGDPIHLDRIGACHYWSLFKHFGEDGMVDYITFVRELNAHPLYWRPLEERLGRRVRRFTVIIDLEGLHKGHIRPALLALLKRTARMSQDYYTGWAKRILIIRASPFFKLVVWPLVKGYFDKPVRDMIEFAGHYDYLDLLDQYIDRENLPSVICPEQGMGDVAPGYYENVKLEGWSIPKAAFRGPVKKSSSRTERSNIAPVFPPAPTRARPTRAHSAPTAPVGGDDTSPSSPPIATTHLLAGFWNDSDETMSTSQRNPQTATPAKIEAFASPEKPFTSPMFKYNW